MTFFIAAGSVDVSMFGDLLIQRSRDHPRSRLVTETEFPQLSAAIYARHHFFQAYFRSMFAPAPPLKIFVRRYDSAAILTQHKTFIGVFITIRAIMTRTPLILALKRSYLPRCRLFGLAAHHKVTILDLADKCYLAAILANSDLKHAGKISRSILIHLAPHQ